MPSAKILEAKQAVVAELAEKVFLNLENSFSYLSFCAAVASP